MICPVCGSKTELSKLNVNNLSDKIRKNISVYQRNNSRDEDTNDVLRLFDLELQAAIKDIILGLSELSEYSSARQELKCDEETMSKFRRITSMDNEETESTREEPRTSKGYLGEASQLVQSGYGKYDFEDLDVQSYLEIKKERWIKERQKKLKKGRSKKHNKGDSD